jgi:hypothetical protein
VYDRGERHAAGSLAPDRSWWNRLRRSTKA